MGATNGIYEIHKICELVGKFFVGTSWGKPHVFVGFFSG